MPMYQMVPLPADTGAGEPVTVKIDPQAGNRLQDNQEGLYVPPVAEGDFADMVILFENALI